MVAVREKVQGKPVAVGFEAAGRGMVVDSAAAAAAAAKDVVVGTVSEVVV